VIKYRLVVNGLGKVYDGASEDEDSWLAVAAREHKSPGPITSIVSGPNYLRIRRSSGPD
jgi:hypothetical protein